MIFPKAFRAAVFAGLQSEALFSGGWINKMGLCRIPPFPTGTATPLPQAYLIKLLSQDYHQSFCEGQVRFLENNLQESENFHHISAPQHFHPLTSSPMASTNSLTNSLTAFSSVCPVASAVGTSAHIPLSLQAIFSSYLSG